MNAKATFFFLFFTILSFCVNAEYGSITEKDKTYLLWMMESSGDYADDNLELAEVALAADLKVLESKNIRELSLKKLLKVVDKYLNPRFKNYNRHTTFEGLFINGDFTIHTAAAYQTIVLNHFGISCEYIQEDNVSYCALVEDGGYYPIPPIDITSTTMITTLDAHADFSHFLTAFGLRKEGVSPLNTMDNDKELYYNVNLMRDMKAISANLMIETGFNYLEAKDLNSFFSLHREAYSRNKNFKNMFWAWNSFKAFSGDDRGDLTHDELDLLCELINQTKEEKENKEVAILYNYWFQKYTGVNMNDSVQDANYQHFMKGLTHQQSIDRIKLIYNVSRADRAIRATNHDDVVYHLGVCLEADPENKNYQKLLVDHYLQHMDEVDPETMEEVVDRFSRLEKRYPFVVDNKQYMEMKVLIYLFNIHQTYDEGDAVKGKEAIALFEEFTQQHPNSDIPEEALGNAFTTASRYYSRRQQKTKARELVQKGLSFDPDNEILTDRMQFLKKYQ